MEEGTYKLVEDPDLHPGRYDPGTPNSSRFLCPVCTWYHDEPKTEVDQSTLAEVFGLGAMTAVEVIRRMERTERVLHEHLQTHSHVEFARALAARDRIITELRA